MAGKNVILRTILKEYWIMASCSSGNKRVYKTSRELGDVDLLYVFIKAKSPKQLVSTQNPKKKFNHRLFFISTVAQKNNNKN